MNIAFLGLGGNMGNRSGNLEKAINALKARCGKVLKKSSVYETEAWGFVSDKKYLNQVVKLETKLSAQELLTEILLIEKNMGRERNERQYSDRSLDIDILFFNNEIISEKNLEIPHTRMHERKFVLVPFNEIEPKFIHPILEETISALLKSCKDNLQIEKYSGENFG